MTDNFYFIFLDEIYSPNLNDMLRFKKEEIFSRKNHLHFGIAGVVVPSSHFEDLTLKSERIKRKYYPKYKNLIFHYVDILNKREKFSDLAINASKKKAFVDSIMSLVLNAKFNYDCVFVDKHELIKKYGVFDKNGRLVRISKIGSNLFPRGPALDYNLYLLCLRKILENFFTFLSNKKYPARAVIIAEARGEREDTELREAFRKVYYNGVSKIKPRELRGIVLDLLIVPKKQNYIGTQLADLILYPTYDGCVPNHNLRNDHFIYLNKIMRRKLLNKNRVTLIPA